MNRVLSITGILVTLIYITILFIMVDGRLSSLHSMKLNEVGDFLAGAFGPLAIFWLILGFFQQGKELSQNTKALELQAEELRSSVEQQKEMVNVAEKQFEANVKVIEYERSKEIQAAKPKIVFLGFGCNHSDEDRFTCNIINSGATSTNVLVSFNVELTYLSGDKRLLWESGEQIRIKFSIKSNSTPEKFAIRFNYKDRDGFLGEERYIIKNTINEQGLPILSIDS